MVTPGALLLRSVTAGAPAMVQYGLIANLGGGASLAGTFFAGAFGKSAEHVVDPPLKGLSLLQVHKSMIAWILERNDHLKDMTPRAAYAL